MGIKDIWTTDHRDLESVMEWLSSRLSDESAWGGSLRTLGTLTLGATLDDKIYRVAIRAFLYGRVRQLGIDRRERHPYLLGRYLLWVFSQSF